MDDDFDAEDFYSFDAEDLCRFGVEHLYSFGGIREFATFGTIADYWLDDFANSFRNFRCQECGRRLEGPEHECSQCSGGFRIR